MTCKWLPSESYDETIWGTTILVVEWCINEPFNQQYMILKGLLQHTLHLKEIRIMNL